MNQELMKPFIGIFQKIINLYYELIISTNHNGLLLDRGI